MEKMRKQILLRKRDPLTILQKEGKKFGRMTSKKLRKEFEKAMLERYDKK